MPGYRYSTLETPIENEVDHTEGFLRQIVLKDAYGNVVPDGFTHLEQFVRPYGKRVLARVPTKQELIDVCIALNYWVEHCGARTYSDITTDMVIAACDYYRDRPVRGDTEHFVNQSTLDRFVMTVTNFACNLGHNGIVSVVPDNLLEEKHVRDRRGKEVKRFVPIYQKKARPSAPGKLLRNMPVEVVDRLIAQARASYPMITFALVLQAYGGLRESEGMNVRQAKSPLSSTPGVLLRTTGTSLSYFGIDLTREFPLRDDHVSVGKVKRKANDFSPIYPPNLQIVGQMYGEHHQILGRTQCDPNYLPMFVNRDGKAMTAQSYVYQFNRLIETLTPSLISDPDPRISEFGYLLDTHSFGPHALRHYFTVKMVLDGADIATVMTYRGDRSPESALAYLAGKNLFQKELEETNTICMEGLQRIGNYVYSGG